MTSCDDFIIKASKELPELCKTKDLVDFGIYSSEQAAYHARKKGLAPDYFKMPHGLVLYPRKGIIEFLEKAKHSSEGFIHETNDTGRPYTKGTSTSNEKRICL